MANTNLGREHPTPTHVTAHDNLKASVAAFAGNLHELQRAADQGANQAAQAGGYSSPQKQRYNQPTGSTSQGRNR